MTRTAALVLSFVAVAACGDATAPPDTTPATVTVAPAGDATLASGATLALSAAVANRSGSVLAGQGVAWSTGDPNVAAVSSAGIVTAVHVGRTTIMASAGTVSSAGVNVTVTPGPASALAVRTQPAGAISGNPLGTQPVIEIRDAAGNVVTSATTTIVATIATGGGALSGTTAVAAVAGVVTYTNLSITGPAGPYTLAFSAPGLTTTPSGNVTITAAVALSIRKLVDVGNGLGIRLVRDPSTDLLYLVRYDGPILRLSLSGPAPALETVYTPAVTGVPLPQGLAFGPDGTMYLVGNEGSGSTNVATVRRGVRSAPGSDVRTWSTLARTVPIPRSNEYDHQYNGIVVSADGASVFLNSGSRTDHGEEQSNKGEFPGLRETPLNALILRLPVDGRDIVLPNDDAALRAAGYVFARGVRNTYDLALDANGELFGGENSGDRDDNDELNLLREGRHYGFPWRMGTNDTPQQFPGYDPSADRLINHAYDTWTKGYFHDDPTYPARPATSFTDPIVNTGPDANFVRDPATGVVGRASDAGRPLSTFTSHRSPLGLVFDVRNELPDRFRGSAFILSWTAPAPSAEAQGPFSDPSQDLLHLVLARAGDSYQTSARRLVCGFLNPMDAEIVKGKLYVLEFSGSGGVYEITLPTGSEAAKPGCVNVPR